MKAFTKFVAATLLLVMLATLPGTLVAFRVMCDRMAESTSAAGSSMEASSYSQFGTEIAGEVNILHQVVAK